MRLAQTLNEELGYRDQRLRFSKIDDRTGATIWRLQNPLRTEQEVRSLPDMAATLEIAADQGALLDFAFTEHWSLRQSSFGFKSSNLRFAITSTDPDALPLRFRLEWAGRELDGGEYLYPGKGAAHPHWQFDGELRTPLTEPAIVGQPAVLDVSLEEPAEVMNLEAPEEPAIAEPVMWAEEATAPGPLPWFHKLHLPARALWAQIECRMPDEPEGQQHEPSSIEELDRWVLSALRYMRHEFATYAY